MVRSQFGKLPFSSNHTSYCNSILQCLYYTVPFREHMLNYPMRSPLDKLAAAAATAPSRPPFTSQQANGAAKKPGTVTTQRNLGSPPTTQMQKPEDKDSPEYKKKQALIAGPILNMNYQNTAGYDMNESLFTALKDIFEAVVVNPSRNGVISPIKFLEVLRRENEMFRSQMHQDAHEFLNLLLNTVVENVDANAKRVEAEKAEKAQARPTENGDIAKTESPTVSFPSFLPQPMGGFGGPSTTRWVHELFEGTLTSETRCLTCENISQRDEPFLDLSVDLDQHSSVTSCLRRFSEEEMLCERNKFHCDNCGGLQEAEKRMKIKRLPKILALHLKRFKYTEDLQRLQKLFHKVVYPYQLRLFNTTDDAEDPDRLYELYAVVVHIGGGPYHGHYVAIIKTEDRGWLLFDDEMVEPVDKSFVRNFFGDRPGLACAYVLFYQETTLEAVQKDQETEEKAREETIGLGLSTNGTAELHRVKSDYPPMSTEDPEKFASLNHAVTAPSFSPEINPPTPLLPPLASPVTPLSPTTSKKDKAKEEKERKAAEKEKEKADKQKKKEELRKQDADIKAAIDASKLSKTEDDKRATVEAVSKENTPQNGTAPAGLDLFRRSKSLRFGSLSKKDRPPALTDEPNTSISADQTQDKDKEKRNRFSIRKKSFGMLN
jgi:ubiquitin carboxyl-terminal hydrolase 9/13